MAELTHDGAWDTASAAISQLQNISVEMIEFSQRVAILVSDLVIIVAAFFVPWEEWTCDDCKCGQPLRAYGIGCVVICFFDCFLEVARCLLEGSLDQLQAECSNLSANSPVSDRGLLGEDTLSPGKLGDSSGCSGARRQTAVLSPLRANPWNYIVQEKSSKQRRMTDLSRLSMGLTTAVALAYSLLPSRDEGCAREMSCLNSYVRVFSYMFILRLGVIILGICCRTVKDYEDAEADGTAFTREQGIEMSNA